MNSLKGVGEVVGSGEQKMATSIEGNIHYLRV